MNTNTYISLEQCNPTRICKLLSGQCIIRVFYNRNFLCNKTVQKLRSFEAYRSHFSSGNEGDIGS